MLLHPVVYQEPFTPFVCAEEEHGAWKRAAESGDPTAVEPPADALLTPYRIVGRAEGCVSRRNVRVALLSSLDGVEGVHQHIASGAAYASSDHGLSERLLDHSDFMIVPSTWDEMKSGAGRPYVKVRRTAFLFEASII